MDEETLRKIRLRQALNKRTHIITQREKRLSYRIWLWIRNPINSFKRFLILRLAKNPNSIYNKEKIN